MTVKGNIYMNNIKKPWDNGILKADGVWLKNGETPFFWLGDTAWLLFQRLTREEMRTYLYNRYERGFNVIQAVAVMNLPGTNIKTGQKPYLDEKTLTPDLDSGYWDNIDYAFDVAHELGMYIGLLPTWGGVVTKNGMDGSVAKAYASFLAQRYGKRDNLIWINGGDCRGADGYEFWDTMGAALKALTPDRLVCYHTFGRTLASDTFYDSKWLDVDMFQSGHRRYDQITLNRAFDNNAQEDFWYGEDNWRYVLRAHAKEHKRPVLDAEPSYENIPHGLHDFTQPRWTAWEVRRYAYWSLLEGACGFTYGHNAIMQFGFEGEPGAFGCLEDWKDAMNHPGADSMKHMKELMTSLPFTTAKPAPELLDCPQGEKHDRISISKGENYVLAYMFKGQDICLKAGVLSGCADIYWVNPQSGIKSYCGRYDAKNEPIKLCHPKGNYDNKDWLLLIKKG